VQIGDESFDDSGADVAFGNKLTDPREPDGDQGEFRGGEKPVEDNEEDYADQTNDEPAVGILLCYIVAGGRTWLTFYEGCFFTRRDLNLQVEESPALRFFGDPRIAKE